MARRLIILVALVMTAGMLSLSIGDQAHAAEFPSVGNRFGDTGPFRVTVARESQHTYFSPTTLGADGLKHPVIIWGNGTFNTPSTYDALLRHFASHGFIVVAANTSSSGNGRAMLAGLDNITTKNGQSSNRFFNKVDLTKVAASGYSQGGGGALAAARDARVDTTMADQPWNASASGVRGPILFTSGSADVVVSPSSVRNLFNSVRVPAAYGELRGASHFEILGNGGGFRSPMTAWARWQLMGDTTARDVFVGDRCTLCTSRDWSEYRVNAQLG